MKLDQPAKIDLKEKLRVIPDWPKRGVNFIDITTLLKDPASFKEVIDILTAYFSRKSVECVVGIEARGFIIGAPIAYNLGVSFVPARKAGKLPHRTMSVEYALEYNSAYLEIHRDAIKRNQRVCVIDDLLATGGTSQATVKLIEKLGGKVVGLGYLVELDFLNARKKLAGYDIMSLVHYDS